MHLQLRSYQVKKCFFQKLSKETGHIQELFRPAHTLPRLSQKTFNKHLFSAYVVRIDEDDTVPVIKKFTD